MSEPNPYAPPQAELVATTSVPVPAGELILADRGTRLGAGILDGIIVVLPAALILFLCDHFFGWNVFAELGPWDTFLTGLALSALAAVLYFAINGRLLASHGQSIGKKVCKIRIAKPDGSIPTLRDSYFKRYVLFVFIQDVPGLGRVVPFVDALMIFRNNRRCLHDEAAETIVVNVPANQR